MTFFFIILTLIVFLTIPFIVECIRVHRIKRDWESNNKEKAIEMIIQDIKRAKKRVYIYGGKGDVYDNALIIDEIIKALERGVNFEIILECNSLSLTRIGNLKDKNNIFLESTHNKKLFNHHFRVIDYNYVYIEKPHPEDSYNWWFKRLINTRFLPGQYSQTFYKIRESVIVS